MGPLSGIRVLDLSRVLAGPWAAQVLADMGADVIKVERPGTGDDTRGWGPPYLKNNKGKLSSEAAYFHCTNRGKRSITIDFSKQAGQDIVRRLLGDTDILVENYKVGTLAKYGLDYKCLQPDFPGLIYASITGFGQDGPYADHAGYDFMIQGMSGLMSVTGAHDGEPQKTGVALTDIITGLYASNAILGALYHRERSGEGQAIDLALMDTAVAVMANQAQNYLASGSAPTRLGNAHPNLVPYNVFKVSDGYIIVTVGNDQQFARLAKLLGQQAWAVDPRFKTNAARVENRDLLLMLMNNIMRTRPRISWLTDLQKSNVPCGPINDMEQVFANQQVIHRGLKIEMPHKQLGSVTQVKSPINYSNTKQEYTKSPPGLGEHTQTILHELGYSPGEQLILDKDGVI